LRTRLRKKILLRLIQDSVYNVETNLRFVKTNYNSFPFLIIFLSAESERERKKRPFTLFKAAFHFPVGTPPLSLTLYVYI
jgi:hypothetical protein